MDHCFFLQGNWSFSWKWTCHTRCHWCCCKRSWYTWCSNCCTLSTASFCRCMLILFNAFCYIMQYVWLTVSLFSRFMSTEVEEQLELLLMGVALHWFLPMIRLNLFLYADICQRYNWPNILHLSCDGLIVHRLLFVAGKNSTIPFKWIIFTWNYETNVSSTSNWQNVTEELWGNVQFLVENYYVNILNINYRFN